MKKKSRVQTLTNDSIDMTVIDDPDNRMGLLVRIIIMIRSLFVLFDNNVQSRR